MEEDTQSLEFDRQLKEKTEIIEEIIRKYLPKEEGQQAKVIEAMNYSLTAGGKRLRPMLMWETYQMCGGSKSPVIESFMAAIEMIHTYSLVHDDLPAMDNDEYRRGRKTTWYVYGDAMGILAGDGLLNYAFETALRAFSYCLGDGEESSGSSEAERASEAHRISEAERVPEAREISETERVSEAREISEAERVSEVRRISKALAVLAGKAGIYGMIGGQTVDIMASGQTGEQPAGSRQPTDSRQPADNGQSASSRQPADRRQPIDDEQIEDGGQAADGTAQLLFIHEYKTAALIQAAMMVGAILAGASDEQVSKLEKCAYNVGLAFQIQDDILDVVGDSRELGKPTGSDALNHKLTYVTIKGLEQSKKDVAALSQEASAILDSFEGGNEFLKQLISALIHRRK